MNNEIGFYNKYLLLNDSYLRSYVIRKTVKENGNCKNINSLIEMNLNYEKIINIKDKADKKKVRFLENNI